MPRRVESWLRITANGLGTKMPWVVGVGLWISAVYSSIAINKHASKQTESSPNPLVVPNGVAKLCAPEFYLIGAKMREAYATRLGSVHLPGDARRTHVRRSRHLLFMTRRSRAVESPGSRGTRYT
ncbi:hypothetical protein CRG98_008806 [Punica granatum]|uniref:Uncharacterized protein n=1 Tax=Punica granatum TaxID=22663 RepID=A0A2I0KQS7_PUNGR|nr:hypothetical protein CRG98_008806 [Punica granatum]